MPTTRRQREEDIVATTKALFDERGMQDAPVDEVARALGINRALIYRHFGSREELYLRTLTVYLDELAERLSAASGEHDDPPAAFRALCTAFADFALDYPAFADCALSLMRRPATELREAVSDGTWFAVGRSMGACLGVSARIIRAGQRSGDFHVRDADLAANLLYAQGLGIMALARSGIGVRELEPGTSTPFEVAPDDAREEVVAAALAYLSRPPRTAVPGTARSAR